MKYTDSLTKSSLALLLFSSLLYADKNDLVTHTELSYINTTGNSVTDSFALDFTADKSFDAHKLRFKADALYSEADIQI